MRTMLCYISLMKTNERCCILSGRWTYGKQYFCHYPKTILTLLIMFCAQHKPESDFQFEIKNKSNFLWNLVTWAILFPNKPIMKRDKNNSNDIYAWLARMCLLSAFFCVNFFKHDLIGHWKCFSFECNVEFKWIWSFCFVGHILWHSLHL